MAVSPPLALPPPQVEGNRSEVVEVKQSLPHTDVWARSSHPGALRGLQVNFRVGCC